MAHDREKDELIRQLGREVAELSYQLIEERQASYEEHGRLRNLLTALYDRLVDADAKSQVTRILREMSDDFGGRHVAGTRPNHEGKRAVH